MKTSLSPAHEAAFAALSEPIVQRIWGGLRKQDPRIDCPAPGTGAELYQRCLQIGADQARVVLTLGGACDQEAVRAIEILVGFKIPPHPEPGSIWFAYREGRPAPPPAKERQAGGDPRIVVEVAPNPRREGSEAHDGYKFWRVGASIDELAAEGLPRRNIRRDIRHGFVKVRFPE